MRTTFEQPLDLTTKTLSLGVRLNRPTSETVEIQLLAPDERNRLVTERYLKQKIGTVRLDIAPGTVTGSPDLTNVKGLSVITYTKKNKPLNVHVGAPRIRHSPHNHSKSRQRGAVILTFDDGHKTQFDVAKPIMDEFGFPGAVGVIPWMVGNNIRMNRKQLHAMAADGWEMASHPQLRDTPLPELSKSRQRRTVERSKRWLLAEGFIPRTLVWPFGKFDERTLDFIGQYHRLAFGGGSTPAPWQITEPGWIPRVNGDNPKAVRNAVDMAARFGTVTTVMYHTIGQSRISIKAFRNEMKYINQANVDVVTPSKLVDAQSYIPCC